MASYFKVDRTCELIYTLNHWGFENLLVHEVFQTLVALGGLCGNGLLTVFKINLKCIPVVRTLGGNVTWSIIDSLCVAQ